MNCRKCGTELHEDQKVCIVCGERTAAGGAFHVEETQPWRPSRNMIIGAAVGLPLLIVIWILVGVLSVTPPETVARQWFDAMSQRLTNRARDYLTPTCDARLGNDPATGLMAISDSIFSAVNQDSAKPAFSPPSYDSEDNPTRANVKITLRYPDTRTAEILVEMVKLGRQWRIDRITGSIF